MAEDRGPAPDPSEVGGFSIRVVNRNEEIGRMIELSPTLGNEPPPLPPISPIDVSCVGGSRFVNVCVGVFGEFWRFLNSSEFVLIL